MPPAGFERQVKILCTLQMNQFNPNPAIFFVWLKSIDLSADAPVIVTLQQHGNTGGPDDNSGSSGLGVVAQCEGVDEVVIIRLAKKHGPTMQNIYMCTV